MKIYRDGKTVEVQSAADCKTIYILKVFCDKISKVIKNEDIRK